MPQEYDLTGVHRASLAVLKEIDRICRKYGIRYQIDSGTLLGAVRHKGFIPWDDDADVAFNRGEYERFRRVVRQELSEGMELLEPDQYQGGKAFYDFTPRIIYKNSRRHGHTAQMEYYEGKLNHLWVDLFIIDELPEGRISAALTRFLHKAVYGLAMGHRDRLDFRKYGLLHKLFVGGLAAAGRIIPMKRIFRLHRAVVARDRKGKSRLRYYSNYQPDYLYVTLDQDWCQQIVEMEFEGVMLMAPAGWKHVLELVYGDYMRLPPPDRRVPTHSGREIQVYD